MEDPKEVYVWKVHCNYVDKNVVRRGKNKTTNNGKERKKTKRKKRLFL